MYLVFISLKNLNFEIFNNGKNIKTAKILIFCKCYFSHFPFSSALFVRVNRGYANVEKDINTLRKFDKLL